MSRSIRAVVVPMLPTVLVASGLGLLGGHLSNRSDDVQLVGVHANLPRPDDQMARIRQDSPYRVREVTSLPATALVMASHVAQSTRFTPDAFSIDLNYVANDAPMHVWTTNISDAEMALDGKSFSPGTPTTIGRTTWRSVVKDDYPAPEPVRIFWTRFDDGVLVSVTVPASFDQASLEAALESLV